ncbi:MAG TPA: ABC transporter ATP-binding protein [Candidatus Saccharimonadales bacterium]|nr:ABC transporter ATP-binding protein [Candidatus Saccharimonadales bacterium]
MKEPVIQLHDVTKRFGSHIAVHKLNLSIQKGEVVGFLGPNGAGKTTTIRMIMGQIGPHDGEILVFGQDAAQQAKQIHKKVGYVGGDMALEDNLTGMQYLQFIARLQGGVTKHTITELAHRFDCDLSKKIRTLSRGNRQKIALISAVMHNPDLLVLDEPSSGFDPLIQAEFNKLILQYKQAGKTVFISSHILSEIEHLCDRLVFIREGKVVKISSLEELERHALKRLKVVFDDARDVEHFRAIPGVEHIASDGARVVCRFGGSLQDLLRKTAALSVADITIEEADLEELFMQYYRRQD